ncbi:uncharacterized protein L203_104682 [Cryptococcus depauperatus CBS 7841]|uniref:Alginate lyase domain-containing protein n=1 Tax=Cryptococcus depauperatus CBS 7841 TaxID=1295531 RepID=A0AAJ8JW19_9TREE
MGLNVPIWSENILTPFPRPDPSPQGLKMLRQICRKQVESNEVYSVTFSEILCPEGKNNLFTLKPYFWEVEPGRWEHRDGKRNPFCDKPKGQKQLESCSMAVHSLALGAVYLLEMKDACVRQLERLLTVFFIDPETRMVPEVWYSQCKPGSKPLRGDYAFVIALRYIILIDQAMRMASDYLRKDIVEVVAQWIATQEHWMKTSEQGAAIRKYEDNKVIWYHAIIASHLSFMVPIEGRKYAQSFFNHYVFSRFPVKYFERDLKRTRPRHYTLFALEPLFIIAELTLDSSRQLDRKIGQCMRDLLEFAKNVQPGEMEKPLEEEGRYEGQWQWYERMMAAWTGEGQRGGEEVNGKAWEAGFTQRMRMLWGFI